MKFSHYPVMYTNIIQILKTHFHKFPNQPKMADCTLGCGGHSYYVKKEFPQIQLTGIDMDPKMIELAQTNLKEFQQVNFVKDNFINIEKHGLFNIVLADLGYNMVQIKDESLGLSYIQDSNLNMRYDRNPDQVTAKKILQEYSEYELKYILESYGQIQSSSLIAKILHQSGKSLNTTQDLVKLLLEHRRKNDIPQVFQALRIATNNELGNLNKFLNLDWEDILQKSGLLMIITFHSLEQRLVEIELKKLKKKIKGRIEIYSPSESEIIQNNPSRSSKLNVFSIQ